MSYQYSSYHEDADDFDDQMDVSSCEDTEDASETESQSNRYYDEPVEIKEQMYQDKLASLKKQLEEVKTMTHPEYLKRIKKLEHQYHERLRINEIYRDYMIDCVERDYIFEKNAAVKEYEEKKVDLRENLLADFEDKRKLIESERHSMELTGDSIELKPTITRKLRRRPNDPMPVVDQKRRKAPSGQLVLLLEDKDIESDLKLISRGKSIIPNTNNSNSNNNMRQLQNNNQSYGNNNNLNHAGGLQHNSYPMNQMGNMSPGENGQQLIETRIEDGKLWYERRWYHRGQAVTIEGRDIPRFSASISAIGNEVIWVKRISDSGKVRIYLKQLQTGKISIKRRAN